MKTIQERADEYASRAWSALNEEFNEDHTTFENIVSAAFVAGAKSEMEDLARWRCPKKELPDYYHTVLIKYIKGGLYTYAAAWLSVSDNNEYLWTIAETNMLISDRSVHYWRPIVELPYDGEKL